MFFGVGRECVRTALRPSHVVSLFLFSQEENAVRVVWVNFAVSGHSSFSSGSARA